jgi:hypothetical protein
MRRIHVERLTLIRRIGIGQIAFDVLSARFGEKNQCDEKTDEVFHGIRPYLKSNGLGRQSSGYKSQS